MLRSQIFAASETDCKWCGSYVQEADGYAPTCEECLETRAEQERERRGLS